MGKSIGPNNFPNRLAGRRQQCFHLRPLTPFTGCSRSLGTDSSPESGKMNLNYDNLHPFVYETLLESTLRTRPASTNFMAWTPLTFFTKRRRPAAARPNNAPSGATAIPPTSPATFYAVTNLTSTRPIGPTIPRLASGRIPVLVSNRFVYSARVNRLLQLAANLL